MDDLVRRDFREDRCPAESYTEVLERDRVPSPDYMRQGPTPDIGTEPIPASRYFDKDYFDKEVEHLWPHVWHWACREEQIPQVGDHVVYEFAGRSFIIVRSGPGEIKALYNSCLHRGRKLAVSGGHKLSFRCPYHGLVWKCDGSFQENPFPWDFPQWAGGAPDLPEARVGTWGGFVFINMDPDAPSLEEVLGPLPAHFERYDFENRYIAAHVVKKVRANWKATAEAFMESHHVIGTHPQGLATIGDANSQYDILSEYVDRQFSATAIQSPHLKTKLSEQQILDSYFGGRAVMVGDQPGHMTLPDGMTARAFAAELARKTLSEQTGHDYSHAGDAEMLDSLLYNVFPHMSFWISMSRNIVYRWRPNGFDPETSLMDIMMLRPVPKDGVRPKPAPVRYMDLDEPMTEAGKELSDMLALVYEQDMVNLPHVQTGLRASGTGTVEFSSYMEARLRYHHQLIDRFIAEGEARKASA